MKKRNRWNNEDRRTYVNTKLSLWSFWLVILYNRATGIANKITRYNKEVSSKILQSHISC